MARLIALTDDKIKVAKNLKFDFVTVEKLYFFSFPSSSQKEKSLYWLGLIDKTLNLEIYFYVIILLMNTFPNKPVF